MAKRVDSSFRELGTLVVKKEMVPATGSRPAYTKVTLWCVCAGAPVPLQVTASSFVIDGKPVASLRLAGSKIADLIQDPA